MFGVVVGVLLGTLVASTYAWTDAPPAIAWVLGGAALALLQVWRGSTPLALGALLTAWLLGGVASNAVGSTWAALSWWPLTLVAFAAGRRSHTVVLVATAILLFRDVATPILLSQTFGSASMSGSVQYYLGFLALAAAPLWAALAVRPARSLPDRFMAAVAIVMAALAMWLALTSGSRAVFLGLGAGTVAVTMQVARHVIASRSVVWRSALLAAASIVGLALVADVGLGRAFGVGQSPVVVAIEGRVTATAQEVQDETRSLGGVRLPLWRQALMAAVARPLGHGPGSYEHVNHAYQNEPLLWSGSPHSVWALAAVETGVSGLVALLALVLGALYRAWRRGSATMPALLGATAVMSLDVFSSMPVHSLIWWALIGAAWGPDEKPAPRWGVWTGRVVVIAVLVVAVTAAFRLASPCDAGCDPIARYGGHPDLVGLPLPVIGTDPTDPRWAEWRALYPYAFWLAYSETQARLTVDPEAELDLLRAYPFQSAQRYADVADAVADPAIGRDVAACGLVRFFDGRPIHRDWRSSPAELDAQRAALEERAQGVPAEEGACVRAAIPAVAIGLQ